MKFKILRSNQLTIIDKVEIPQALRRSENGWTVMAQSNNKYVIDKIWADLYPKDSYRLITDGRSGL